MGSFFEVDVVVPWLSLGELVEGVFGEYISEVTEFLWDKLLKGLGCSILLCRFSESLGGCAGCLDNFEVLFFIWEVGGKNGIPFL